jgi:dihydrofolate synthase/folylpolyglutamate synthase
MSNRIETYEQAIEFLYNRINYERVSASEYSAADLKLDRMRELLRQIGAPQSRIPAVHIAGTKGKGSTAAMISRILDSAGYRVGLFTSPHLTAFEERMSVNGRLPTQRQIVELVNAVGSAVADMDKSPGWMSPTYFEIATAMAWLYFVSQQVDLAVLEVGLGGRLDATNVCQPEVCVITTISRDHTRLLGSRLSQIAREKAGIVKPGIPVVSGVSESEPAAAIAEVCRELSAPLRLLGRNFEYRIEPAGSDRDSAASAIRLVDISIGEQHWRRVPLALRGRHQAHNAALAVAAAQVLQERGWNVPHAAIHDGLRQVSWPARVEIVATKPTVIVDAAHNWAAVAALLRTLDDFAARRRVLIFAATQDKDVEGMLRQLLPRFDTVIATNYLNNPRAVPAGELARQIESITESPYHIAPDPAAAWKLARRLATPEDLICITGSFFIAAEARDLITDNGLGNCACPEIPSQATTGS